MKRRWNGFTLIEILVVIGIILILISIAVIGYRVVQRSASLNQTKTTLNNLNSMLAELDATAGSDALPEFPYTDTSNNPQTFIGAGSNSADPNDRMIGDVTPPEPPGNAPDGRYGFIVTQTQMAMAALMRVPNNKKALSQLPSGKVLQDVSGNGYPPTVGPVLLDGWDNPIIYVPRGGISVFVTTGNSTLQQITIKSRDNRPFFASAGPDGNFGAENTPTQAFGDDNVYSKQ